MLRNGIKIIVLLFFITMPSYAQKKWHISMNIGNYHTNNTGGIDITNNYKYKVRVHVVTQLGFAYESYSLTRNPNLGLYLRNGLQLNVLPTFFPPIANESLKTKAFVYLTNSFGAYLFQTKKYASDIGIDVQLLTNKFVMKNIVDFDQMQRIYITPYLYFKPVSRWKQLSLGIKYDALPFLMKYHHVYGNSRFYYTRTASIKCAF